MSDEPLRIHALELIDIQLENQDGPVTRHRLSFAVSPLFPGSHPADVQWIRLVVDKTQLSLLRDQILALDLPATTDLQPPTFQ